MGLLDNLGEKFQDVAKKSGELAQTAAKKSGEMMEIAKLNYKIKEEESLVRENYKKLGKLIYEKYCDQNDIPSELLVFIDSINKRNNEISLLNNKIEEIKNYSDIVVTDDDFVKYNKTEDNDNFVDKEENDNQNNN